MRSRVHLSFVLLAVAACAGESAESTDPTGGGGAGGVPDTTSCGALEVVAEDGSCLTVGVTSCPPGFSPADGGCAAIMPAAPCGPGLMALPGESACRPIADCGDDTWGRIERDASTQHVDASYPNMDSDGTDARPWRTIQEGVDAAAPGATVAVAAGTYADVAIAGDGVVLWGRCPDMVTIVGDGSGGGLFGIDIFDGANGTVVRGVAVTGSVVPIGVTEAEDVLVDQVRIFDTTEYGFDVEDVNGPATVTLSRSLVERAGGAGLYVDGDESLLVVESTEVRDTQPLGIDGSGRGVNAEEGGSVVLLDSVVHGSLGAAVSVSGSLRIERSHVYATAETNLTGRGVNVDDGVFICIDSVIEDNVESGIILLGAEGDITRCTVRESRGAATGDAQARGLGVQDGSLVIVDSIVLGSDDMGISIIDSNATLERTVVAQVRSGDDDLFGDGIGVVQGTKASDATITNVLVTAGERAGIAVFGSSTVITGSRFECNAIDLNAQFLGSEAMLTDGGGNVCGCVDEAKTCAVKSVELEAPQPPM